MAKLILILKSCGCVLKPKTQSLFGNKRPMEIKNYNKVKKFPLSRTQKDKTADVYLQQLN
jgi:hypothetical protein